MSALFPGEQPPADGGPPQLFELPKMPESGALSSWASESARQLASAFDDPSAESNPLLTLGGGNDERANPKKGRGMYAPKDNLRGYMISDEAPVAPIDIVDGYKAGRETSETAMRRERIQRSGGVAHALKPNDDPTAADSYGGYMRLQSKASNERSISNKSHGLSDEADPLRGAHKGTTAKSLQHRAHGGGPENDIFSGSHKGGTPAQRVAASTNFVDNSATEDAVFSLINTDGTVQYVRAAPIRGYAHRSTVDLGEAAAEDGGAGRLAAQQPGAAGSSAEAERLRFGAMPRKVHAPMSAPWATFDDAGTAADAPPSGGSARVADAHGAAGHSSSRINDARRRTGKRYNHSQQASHIFSAAEPEQCTAAPAAEAAMAARLVTHPNSSAATRAIFGGAEADAQSYDSHFAARYATAEAAGASSTFLGGAGSHKGGKGCGAASLYSGSSAAATFNDTGERAPREEPPSQPRSRARAMPADPSAAGARIAERPSTASGKGSGMCRPTQGDARSAAPFDTPLRPQIEAARPATASSSARRPRAQPLGAGDNERFLTTNMANARISAHSQWQQ